MSDLSIPSSRHGLSGPPNTTFRIEPLRDIVNSDCRSSCSAAVFTSLIAKVMSGSAQGYAGLIARAAGRGGVLQHLLQHRQRRRSPHEGSPPS